MEGRHVKCGTPLPVNQDGWTTDGQENFKELCCEITAIKKSEELWATLNVHWATYARRYHNTFTYHNNQAAEDNNMNDQENNNIDDDCLVLLLGEEEAGEIDEPEDAESHDDNEIHALINDRKGWQFN